MLHSPTPGVANRVHRQGRGWEAGGGGGKAGGEGEGSGSRFEADGFRLGVGGWLWSWLLSRRLQLCTCAAPSLTTGIAGAAQEAEEGRQEAGARRIASDRIGWGLLGCVCGCWAEKCVSVTTQGKRRLCISAAQPRTWCRNGTTQAEERRRRKVGGRCEADGVRCGVRRWVMVAVVIFYF